MNAREKTITEAIQIATAVIGNEAPTSQFNRVLDALRGMRDQRAQALIINRVDYLDMAQKAVHRAWITAHGHTPDITGPEHDAIAGVNTPIGRLKAITYRRRWQTGRIAWATEYYLDDVPITIAEIRAAGLAQRPTSRNRQRRK